MILPRNSLDPRKDAAELRILACASQGSGGDDEARLKTLLSHCNAAFLSFDRRDKRGSFKRCLRAIQMGGYDLLVLEGTGIAAGLPAIAGALLLGRRFVLGSGDAVGPFLSARLPLAKPLFHLYERLLYRTCSGFIGWTPYLVGRALTMGARHAITCAGWAPFQRTPEELSDARKRVRAELGIAEDAVVFGIAGALTWSERYQYCYGLELVRAWTRRPSKACLLIVGDGSGLAHLEKAAGDALGKNIFLTGRVERARVPEYLAAMDLGSLPQSVDQVGGFRYTTKIAEYRSVHLPFLTNLNPVAYDLDRGDIMRLPGNSPWDETFLSALADLMATANIDDLHTALDEQERDADFDREAQVRKVTAFLHDIAANGLPRSARAGATA